ncbi:MAG: hypothetical protein K0S33_2170 [Bacteroidetes bacterium]|jgi:hypothetical protein|nr:hypothetical protein [Bacteroidota bacterium]
MCCPDSYRGEDLIMRVETIFKLFHLQNIK